MTNEIYDKIVNHMFEEPVANLFRLSIGLEREEERLKKEYKAAYERYTDAKYTRIALSKMIEARETIIAIDKSSK
jgi:hypothetical protein